MRHFLTALLKLLARATLARYQPRVVGITGSVGKTSTKEAVVAVLATHYRVRGNSKNLNNEIGLPLAIFGESDSGYRNPLAWLSIIGRALWQLVVHTKGYPEVLVLEYGVDHKGDIDYLLSIARPEVAVVTAVGPTHLEFLGTVEAVAREKGKLVAALGVHGTAVLNADDEQVAAMRNRTKARVVTYGLRQADVRADSVSLSRGDDGATRGVSFKLVSGGSSVPMLLSGVVGMPPVASALAAASVGLSFGLTPIEVGNALRNVAFPPGRLRLIPGIKSTLLLDDTYNSSPRAAYEALQAFVGLPLPTGAQRWVILGDMLELGEESNELHQQVGASVAQLKLDYLVTVGERSREFTHGAVASGFPLDHTWNFARAEEAGRFVQDRLRSGDQVLIKGSQGVRCEKVTKELMAEPSRAHELLVRQHKPWL